MKILCKLGIHRPLSLVNCNFIDKVSGKMVWIGKCPCGLKWQTDGNKWFGFKIDWRKH